MEPRFVTESVLYHHEAGDYREVILGVMMGSRVLCRMRPKNAGIIVGVPIDDACGEVSNLSHTGNFMVSWDEDVIELSVSHYGSEPEKWDGADLTLTYPATPSTMASLRSALRVWKDAVKDNV